MIYSILYSVLSVKY